MDTKIADRITEQYPCGAMLNEGKTKKVFEVKGRSDFVILGAKEDITAGDGAKHDILSGKAALATQTTCNVFRLLSACGLPVAFEVQDTATSFVAQRCSMLPYEVVVRREAHGSCLKMNPHLSRRHLFPRLVVEFFLKTKGKKWKEHDLICDDPLMSYNGEAFGKIYLFDPKNPIHGQESFLTLHTAEVFTISGESYLFPQMIKIARQAFLILEKAWQIETRTLVDFKVEFGLSVGRRLLMADVVDNDSWRVLDAGGEHTDKQVYRDGGDLDTVLAKYREVADLTDRFRLPHQQIIFWYGSPNDAVTPFNAAFHDLLARQPAGFAISTVICSAHKEPVRTVETLHRLLQEVPDSVVIAYVGMSNAAGPILSAASTVPVIAVPANVGEFPDDIWSSLRTPSDVPVTVVLKPANALLAALQILSLRNPFFYMLLRERVEERMGRW